MRSCDVAKEQALVTFNGRPELDAGDPIKLTRWLQWLGDRVDQSIDGLAELKRTVQAISEWRVATQARKDGAEAERGRQQLQLEGWMKFGVILYGVGSLVLMGIGTLHILGVF